MTTKEIDMQTFGEIPEGMKECPNCNEYGSSLHEDSARCSRCGGSGLVPDDGEGPDEPPPAAA